MAVVFRGRAVVAALLAALALAGATGANAAIVISHDDQGRTITFDVRAATVDTEWYASVLRAAAHGNEISNVTITIVPENQIPALCGGEEAAACYSKTAPATRRCSPSSARPPSRFRSRPRFRSSSTGAGRSRRSTGSVSPSASSDQVGE